MPKAWGSSLVSERSLTHGNLRTGRLQRTDTVMNRVRGHKGPFRGFGNAKRAQDKNATLKKQGKSLQEVVATNPARTYLAKGQPHSPGLFANVVYNGV